MLKKIVVIGPESTGKSTLCKQLAEHYKSLWCPEFSREYLLKHGMHYEYDDLLTIAKGQLALEDKHLDELQKRMAPRYSPLAVDDSRFIVRQELAENGRHGPVSRPPGAAGRA